MVNFTAGDMQWSDQGHLLKNKVSVCGGAIVIKEHQ